MKATFFTLASITLSLICSVSYSQSLDYSNTEVGVHRAHMLTYFYDTYGVNISDSSKHVALRVDPEIMYGELKKNQYHDLNYSDDHINYAMEIVNSGGVVYYIDPDMSDKDAFAWIPFPTSSTPDFRPTSVSVDEIGILLRLRNDCSGALGCSDDVKCVSHYYAGEQPSPGASCSCVDYSTLVECPAPPTQNTCTTCGVGPTTIDEAILLSKEELISDPSPIDAIPVKGELF